MSTQNRGKNIYIYQNKKYKNKNKMCRGGAIFSICSVWSLTQCHSWNSLPCSHQQFSIIATFYSPPATTISFYSTTSSPEKENPSSNRLGTPLSRGGWEARRDFGPSTHYRIIIERTLLNNTVGDSDYLFISIYLVYFFISFVIILNSPVIEIENIKELSF